MYTIDITLEDKRWKKALPGIGAWCEKACAAALDACGVGKFAPEAGVSILLTDDKKIRELNKDYRGKDKPTNVLSFPSVLLQPDRLSVLKDDADSGIPVLLGDIVLSYDTVAAEAKAEGKTLEAHLAHMVVHAALHLLGHDHLIEDQAEIMETKEAEVLASLGVANPYND